MNRKKIFDRAYDKATPGRPIKLSELERQVLDQKLYWCQHEGEGPWPRGPKSTLIAKLKKKYRTGQR